MRLNEQRAAEVACILRNTTGDPLQGESPRIQAKRVEVDGVVEIASYDVWVADGCTFAEVYRDPDGAAEGYGAEVAQAICEAGLHLALALAEVRDLRAEVEAMRAAMEEAGVLL